MRFRSYNILASVLFALASGVSWAQVATPLVNSTPQITHTDGTRLDQAVNQGRINGYGAARLKRFQTYIAQAAARPYVVRCFGTSISYGSSNPGGLLAQSLQQLCGTDQAVYTPFASQATSPISGWKAQYYAGPFTLRLRGNSGEGATATSVSVRGASLTVYYGTETDGGSITWTVDGAAQTPINCNGTQSVHNSVTVTLDPTVSHTVTFTPPASGYGYLEAYFCPPAGNRRGVRYDNLSFGGSALKHVFAGTERGADAGMAASQSVTNQSQILTQLFAPTDAGLKPDLLIISGPTNDINQNSSTGQITAYKTELAQALAAAEANGTDVIYVQEPANGNSYPAGKGGSTAAGVTSTGQDDGTSNWGKTRTAVQQDLALYADDAFYFDWDYGLKYAAFADRYHDQGSLGNPHPGDVGFGDGYRVGGLLLCAAMGVPPPSGTPPALAVQPRFAHEAQQQAAAENPLWPVGTLWYDTSNGGELKRKAASLAPPGALLPTGFRGLWQVVEGADHPNLAPAIDATVTPASYTAGGTAVFGVDAGGESSVTLPPGSRITVNLPTALMVPGAWYTLSFTLDGTYGTSSNGTLAPYLFIGNQSNQASLSGDRGAFSGSLSAFTYVAASTGAPVRSVTTFQYPTAAQLATMASSGISTGTFYLRTDTVANSGTVTLSQIRLEPGASLCDGQGPASALLPGQVNTQAVSSATEPDALTAGMQAGARWLDTSNSASPILKELVWPGGVSIEGSATLYPGRSLWRVVRGNGANLMPTTGINGGFTSAAGGPGLPVTVFTAVNGGGSNQTPSLSGGSGVSLVANAWYTFSFLYKGVGGNSYTQFRAGGLIMNGGNQTASDWGTYVNGNSGGGWGFQVPDTTAWHRVSFKFQAPASPSGTGFVPQWRASPGANFSVCDCRLEMGQSVCLDKPLVAEDVSASKLLAPMTSPSATTATPTTVTKWMQVYDASGNAVGYVPVFAITP